jgi:hypothetical protein
MSFPCLKKVVGITLFKTYSIGFRSEWGGKSYPEPSGFHPYMLHFMALQIIKYDNIVNCIKYYDSLFPGVRELEKGKNEPSPFEGEGFIPNCAESCILVNISLFPQTGKEG